MVNAKRLTFNRVFLLPSRSHSTLAELDEQLD